MDRDKIAAGVAKATLEVAGRMVGLEGGRGLVRLLDEPRSRGWDPVVPADLHSNPLPAVADDGTAECWQCKARLPFDQLDIARNSYSCRPCMLRTAKLLASHDAEAVDVEQVKIGRGRWWFWPLLVTTILVLSVVVIVLRA